MPNKRSNPFKPMIRLGGFNPYYKWLGPFFSDPTQSGRVQVGPKPGLTQPMDSPNWNFFFFVEKIHDWNCIAVCVCYLLFYNSCSGFFLFHHLCQNHAYFVWSYNECFYLLIRTEDGKLININCQKIFAYFK